MDADAKGLVFTEEKTSVTLLPKSFSMIGRMMPGKGRGEHCRRGRVNYLLIR